MKIVLNVISDVRNDTAVLEFSDNQTVTAIVKIPGKEWENPGNVTKHNQEVKTVLLSDIVRDVTDTIKQGRPVPMVIKMDIECMECKAVMGSIDLFTSELVVIPYIVMEFGKTKDVAHTNPHCPRPLLEEMVRRLVAAGYDPHVEFLWDKLGQRKVWLKVGVDFLLTGVEEETNVFWQHRRAAPALTRMANATVIRML